LAAAKNNGHEEKIRKISKISKISSHTTPGSYHRRHVEAHAAAGAGSRGLATDT
jgi:hypothetical protein